MRSEAKDKICALLLEKLITVYLIYILSNNKFLQFLKPCWRFSTELWLYAVGLLHFLFFSSPVLFLILAIFSFFLFIYLVFQDMNYTTKSDYMAVEVNFPSGVPLYQIAYFRCSWKTHPVAATFHQDLWQMYTLLDRFPFISYETYAKLLITLTRRF